MAEKETFDGRMLNLLLEFLDNGEQKISALQDAIRQADEAKDAYWQLFFRFQYVCQLSGYDDPAKAIPAAAEFGTIYEEHPNALPKDGGQECYLMTTELGIDPIVDLPQIPMSQWEALMERYHTLVKRYDMGYRTYWHQMARFWEYIDKEKAYEHFQTFWNTPRDVRSDCEACERGFAVHMAMMMGDRKTAAEFARPIETGEMSCHDVPQMVWRDYLEDALNRENHQEAALLADKLYRIGDRDKSDLSYLGAVVRCWAYTDLDRAVEKTVQRLEWTLGMWDQKKVYDFYKGAWVCFRQLANRQETVKLNLPREFALYRVDGVYNCNELAGWFHDQAETIGKRFDQRNGSDYYAKDLALAG